MFVDVIKCPICRKTWVNRTIKEMKSINGSARVTVLNCPTCRKNKNIPLKYEHAALVEARTTLSVLLVDLFMIEDQTLHYCMIKSETISKTDNTL